MIMQSKIRFGLAIFALLSITACSSNTNRIETGGTERTNVHLNESAALLVTTPKDGGYRGKIYGGSGAIVASRIDASLSRYARLVDVSPTPYHSLNTLQDEISKNGYEYIVVPTIIVWENKDKPWSKIPSQINVKISVIDTATGKEVSSNFLQAKGTSSSSIFSIFDTTSDTDGPEGLLSEMADDYVDTLYGANFIL
jgi:hypothetical protein